MLQLFGRAFKADPYPTYANLRAECPIYRRPNGNGQGATHFVTRYDEVATIFRDATRFVKDYRSTLNAAERAALPEEPALLQLLSRHMLNADAPAHTRLRALVNKAFTVRMVEQMEERVQTIADQLVARALRENTRQSGQMDLIEQFAFPLPLIVIAELLGIPARDRNRFRAWSHALVQPTPNQQRNEKKISKSRQLMEDFVTYLRARLDERRGAGRDDLITSLLLAEEAGDALSEDEIFSTLLLLIVVGHETSVNLIGNGMLTLFRHPQQLEMLRADPSLIPNALEELIRFDGPVERAPMRFASTDAEIAGVQIERGDAVSLVLAAANRDPAHFAEPDQLDLLRQPNRHLGFGLGPHYCLGAALARLEGRVALTALLTQLPNLRPQIEVEQLRWRTNPIMRGLHHLPVSWGENPRG